VAQSSVPQWVSLPDDFYCHIDAAHKIPSKVYAQHDCNGDTVSPWVKTSRGVHELKIDMHDYVRDFTSYAKYRKIWLGGLFPAVR